VGVNGQADLDPDPEPRTETPARPATELGGSGGVLGREAPAGVPLAVGPTVA
jgi:hypothetical protein